MASTSMGMFNTQLPHFNGKNYDYWSITMRALFISQDLWELVEYGFEEPADETTFNNLTQGEKDLLKLNRKKDAKAILLLHQALEQSILPRIVAATSSHKAWKSSRQPIKAWRE